jgi:Arc/MetJ-type ribon-helix-helix transcriptional regulator
MVKSTVRYPETVMDHVEEMVAEGMFSSKSEFQRFAVEYVLSETTDYEPEIVDFDEISTEVLPQKSVIQEAEETSDSMEKFLEIAARIRQFAVRGEIGTAEEYMDTHYPPTDPRSMLLDDLLTAYRPDTDSTPDQD